MTTTLQAPPSIGGIGRHSVPKCDGGDGGPSSPGPRCASGHIHPGCLFAPNRILIAQQLPFDPALMVAPVSITMMYDERGVARDLKVAGRSMARIDELTASGRVLRSRLGNGVTEENELEARTERLKAQHFGPQGATPLGNVQYSKYDGNDNPGTIHRT